MATTTTTSFSLPKDILENFKRMFPRYGARSKIVQYLLKQVIAGKIQVPK